MKPSFSAWSESDYEEEEDNEPVRTRIQRKGIGIIEMDIYEDDMVWWYRHCKEYGFRVRMGPKILKPNEVKQPDYENWLECADCGLVTPTYVQEHDATIIVDCLETVETPFENQTEIMGLPKRTSKQGIKARKQRNKPTRKDKEIQREIDQVDWQNVNILYDSDP